MRGREPKLHFAEMKGRVKDRLKVYGIFDRIGAASFHPTVGSAVRAYLEAHPDVEWQDWEDEPVPPEDGPTTGDQPAADPSDVDEPPTGRPADPT